jgi:hypothetical protein
MAYIVYILPGSSVLEAAITTSSPESTGLARDGDLLREATASACGTGSSFSNEKKPSTEDKPQVSP